MGKSKRDRFFQNNDQDFNKKLKQPKTGGRKKQKTKNVLRSFRDLKDLEDLKDDFEEE